MNSRDRTSGSVGTSGSGAPSVVIQDSLGETRWLRFQGLQTELVARESSEVMAVLRRAQAASDDGLFVAGFLTYEAAPAMDCALVVRPPETVLPLVWLGVFSDYSVEAAESHADDGQNLNIDWTASMDEAEYGRAIERIRNYLRSGDTYQVNFTFQLSGCATTPPWRMFRRMCAAQQAHCCAYVETADFAICSASPEVFLVRQGHTLKSLPMKGTCRRGLTLADDEARATDLRDSAKTHAENVMITDMIRNDMGRIADAGSVTVSSLFDVARYPTLWQMTSTVQCRTDARLPEIMGALFPCASVTGAPKVRTTEIIRELETVPRGVYTGTVGYLLPGGDMHWNVAIRTMTINKKTSEARYGIGSGIVWDSDTGAEYDECLLKARVLGQRLPSFDLLETLLWTPEEGYVLLERHLRRLCDSARYFSYPVNVDAVRRALAETEANEGSRGRFRARLLVASDGVLHVESVGLPVEEAPRTWRVRVAPRPISSAELFLYHKTTHRRVYEEAREACPDVDDVILWNEAGDVTESTIANVVVEKNGRFITPPVSAGLLDGTLRRELIEQGRLEEGKVTLDTLQSCDALHLINSVRGWMVTERVV